jgi:transcriptional regulator with XRE-family HTH domain
MWRDKILAARKEKGVTIKYMAEYAKMSEKSVGRILNDKEYAPRVDDVIALGASVGLSPQEIFSETTLVVNNQEFADLKAQVDKLQIEVSKLTADNDILRMKLEHKEEIVKHKDDIISLLREKSNC